MVRVMLSMVFVSAAAVHILILLSTLRLRAGGAEWIVRLLLLGLVADNLILALGGIAFDAPWYYGASWLRYFAHVLLLPPLALAALLLAQRAGLSWSGMPVARWAIGVFVVAAILVGLGTEIVNLELVKETLFGHDRYVSADAMPPIATILTNLVVLVIAGAIWRQAGWTWLFLAALAILLVNGSSAGKEWGIIAGNLAEIVFLVGWVVTLYRFPPERTA